MSRSTTHGLDKVRAQVLAEHDEIRDKLHTFGALAQSVPDFPDARHALRRGLLGLAEYLVEHLALEERLLAELERSPQPAAADEAEMLAAHHGAYQELVAVMCADLVFRDASSELVLSWWARLQGHLIAEMDAEEAMLGVTRRHPLDAWSVATGS